MAQQQTFWQQSKGQWIAQARDRARWLLRSRPTVTIEDVLELAPRPIWVHQNSCGSVFQHPDFEAVGYTRARKPSSNGRVIRKWALTNPVRPEYDSDH